MTGRLIAAVGLVLVLAGCGQKGPLYLPAPEPAKTVDSNAQNNDPSIDSGGDSLSR